jgi:3-hydroxyacyl-CoA dehydrogenase
MEYKFASTLSLPSLDKGGPLPLRLKALLGAEPAADKTAAFYWKVLPELWSYAANRIGEVTETLVDIDRAMTSGFNWELGPFAMWDAAGVAMVVERMRALEMPIPASAEKLLAAGGETWYRGHGSEYFDVPSGSYRPVKRNPEQASIALHKQAKGVFAGNASVSLVDLGDGIGCLELHSKMNSLGDESVSFLHEMLQPGSDAVRNFTGFVISTDAQNFSVGANILQLLERVRSGRWDELATVISQFQQMTQAVKFCPRPVVAAPTGMALGGGCEICLHATRRQSHLELTSGLVEAGVGLIPGGGGCKEMVLRAIADADTVKPEPRGESVEILETIRAAFEMIVMAKVSTSAADARSMHFLTDSDAITMNRSRLVTDAKAQAMRLVREGFTAPMNRRNIPAPGASVFATLKLAIYLMQEGGFASQHDVKVATHVAKILTGGDITPGTLLTEDYLLELERQAFLSLCGEPKTLERIEYTLKTGKPLRN